jgi:hypothetical protein
VLALLLSLQLLSLPALQDSLDGRVNRLNRLGEPRLKPGQMNVFRWWNVVIRQANPAPGEGVILLIYIISHVFIVTKLDAEAKELGSRVPGCEINNAEKVGESVRSVNRHFIILGKIGLLVAVVGFWVFDNLQALRMPFATYGIKGLLGSLDGAAILDVATFADLKAQAALALMGLKVNVARATVEVESEIAESPSLDRCAGHG